MTDFTSVALTHLPNFPENRLTPRIQNMSQKMRQTSYCYPLIFLTQHSTLTCHWVCAWRQHEYQWCTAIGIIVGPLEIKRRGFNVYTSHVFSNEPPNGWNHFVGPQTSEDHHPLQTMKKLPGSRECFLVGPG